LAVRTIVVRRADERQSLLNVVLAEGVDWVVLSAHGSTCNRAQSSGSVTTHMLAHSSVPLLVLQDLPEPETDRAREFAEKDMAPERRASLLRASSTEAHA
jgi:hypothetical protein